MAFAPGGACPHQVTKCRQSGTCVSQVVVSTPLCGSRKVSIIGPAPAFLPVCSSSRRRHLGPRHLARLVERDRPHHVGPLYLKPLVADPTRNCKDNPTSALSVMSERHIRERQDQHPLPPQDHPLSPQEIQGKNHLFLVSVRCFSAATTILSFVASPFRLRTASRYCRAMLVTLRCPSSPSSSLSSLVWGRQNGSNSITLCHQV